MNEKTAVYAVIDTNVLISALLSANATSNPSRVIKSVFAGIITPLYDAAIIEEYRDVLSRKKFNFDSAHIDDIIAAFLEFGINTVRTPITDEFFPDPDDIVFYEISMTVDGSYLITGNKKHFPERPFVVTPAQMIEILTKKDLLK